MVRWLFTWIVVAALVCPGGVRADTAPWDAKWRQFVFLQVQEPAGLARDHEPVAIKLPLQGMTTERLQKELRVVELPQGKLVPAQVGDNQQVVFLASVNARETKTYRVYFDNPAAPPVNFKTGLTTEPVADFVKVEPPRPFGLSIRNEHIRVDLHPRHGQIGKLAYMKGTGELRTFAGGDADSKLHFNPDLRNRQRLFDPPYRGFDRGWEYTHYWDPPPNVHLEKGPVMFRLKRWGSFTHNTEVFCAVTYTIFAHQPYIVVDTELRMLEDYELEFLRDDEFGFKFGYNRALWKENSGAIKAWDLRKIPVPGDKVHGVPVEAHGIIPLEPDCPWITFFNDETGEGVGTIHTAYKNTAVGKVKMDPPMAFIHARGAAYNYWGRVLAGKLHRLPQAQIPKGCEWLTQSVVLFHSYNGQGQPEALLHHERVLRNPLRVSISAKGE